MQLLPPSIGEPMNPSEHFELEQSSEDFTGAQTQGRFKRAERNGVGIHGSKNQLRTGIIANRGLGKGFLVTGMKLI
jgi:hypothetical protein